MASFLSRAVYILFFTASNLFSLEKEEQNSHIDSPISQWTISSTSSFFFNAIKQPIKFVSSYVAVPEDSSQDSLVLEYKNKKKKTIPILDPLLIKTFIHRGHYLLNKLNGGEYPDYDQNYKKILDPFPEIEGFLPPPVPQDQKDLITWAYTEDMISILWALKDHSDKNNESFERGSFSIIDENSYLIGFFDRYMQHLYPSTNIEDIHFFLGNNMAYKRTGDLYSSHYRSSTLRQWGIDIRFSPNCYAYPLLPYANMHILVGRVKTQTGKEKTFVKWEPHGLDKGAIIQHAREYCSNSVNDPKLMKRESIKDIPLQIIEEIKRWPALLDKNKKYDIALLWEKCHGRQEKSDYPTLKELLKTFYASDNMEWRSGNEVVVNLSNLAKYYLLDHL